MSCVGEGDSVKWLDVPVTDGRVFMLLSYRSRSCEVIDDYTHPSPQLPDGTVDQSCTSEAAPSSHKLTPPFSHDPDWETDSMESV